MVMGREFLSTGVLSIDPLVTYTRRLIPAPLGLPGSCPELFRGRKSLNFISASWLLYQSDIEDIARHWRRTAEALPDALVIFLANTEGDVLALSKAGVPTLPCNVSMLIDEKTYKPLPAMDFSDAAYDAVYNARFEPYKRHELAVEIENLALINDARSDGSTSPHEAEVRKLLPKARYVNHEHGRGRHAPMSKEDVARAINRARCGLCLSKSEGAMKASLEYLFCGVPVVSTESEGGRDRYYQEPYAIIVPDDPTSVASAVKEIKRRRLSKLAIRDHIGRLVDHERRNILAAINGIARKHFGVRRLFEDLSPFIQSHPFTEPRNQWSWRRLAPVAAALGVTLEPLEDAKS